jgi:Dolichyl-phosphate-mannose-protein mannosyltransferase
MTSHKTSIYKHSAFPISLLVLISLGIGLLTFNDYGMSWDEPLFYKYADAIPYAYSVSARLNGNYNILDAYGPSATDHMMYGPAYLLLARPLVLFTTFISGTDNASAWHLINFIVFLLGVVFLYLLCLRLMTRWAAFCTSLLLVAQPLLWGHAFINPKDMPFTAFFILAIYTGFKMVDAATSPDQHFRSSIIKTKYWNWLRSGLWALFFIFFLCSVAIFVFRAQIQAEVPRLLGIAIASPNSFLGTLFKLAANNTSQPNLDAYISRGLSIVKRIPVVLFIITFLIGAAALFVTFASQLLVDLYSKIKVNFRWRSTLIASLVLGILAAIRVLGPLAGLLVSLFYLFKFKWRSLSGIFVYGFISFLIMFILWPYLWHSPISGLLAVFRQMSNNPQTVPILFAGQVISSRALPASYFPTMLGITLTEPVWILFLIGVAIAIILVVRRQLDWKEITPIGMWFLIPFIYVITTTPPQYDGFRHFTFLIPSVFIFIGFAFLKLFERNPYRWANPIIVFLLVLPGVLGIIRLHPYEYTYYNSFVGGTKGAFRKYEADYWLTCYKEAFNQLKEMQTGQKELFVYKNVYLATQYAGDQFVIKPYEPNADTTRPGDLLLMTSRTNYDLSNHPDDPSLLTVSRDGVEFCSIKAVK